MAYDARIILANQSPDIVGEMARGNALASQTLDMRRTQELQDLYRNQGAGILAGDQGALNALAGMDPASAMGFQNSIFERDMAERGMGLREEELKMAQENGRMRAAEFAAGMDASQRAEAAAAVEKAIAMGTQAQTPEQWDAIMQSFGDLGAEYVGRFADRDLIIAGAVGISDALKMNAPESEPESIRALRIRAAEAGLQEGTEAYQAFMQNGGKAPDGFRFEMQPDGSVTLAQGGAAATGKPLTEGQSKDVVFATRAEGALSALEPVAGELTSWGQRAANADPTGLVRGMVQSDDFQTAQQAGQEFLQAILRKDTGAAITEQEEEQYGKTYLPQPGDGEAVLVLKAAARRRAVDAIKAGMPASAILAQERALAAGGEAQPGPAATVAAPASTTAPPANVDPADWEVMTPEEKALFGG